MSWVDRISTISVRRDSIASWFIALVFFAASLALRFLFAPVLPDIKFLTFYPAIVAATFICGWPQGLAVLICSTLAVWYFFMEPLYSLALKDITTIAGLVGFVLVSGVILLLVAALRETVRRLEAAKAEQQNLYSELQHRVANNLQLVVTLLRNAHRDLHNPERAGETINEAEARIMALSQLHRRLNDGTAFVSGLEPLLREMLKNTFEGVPSRVGIEIDVKDGSKLSVHQMTAIALLVNEAALNAVKHVFSKGLGTRFNVRLSSAEDGNFHLVIQDDGPGMTEITYNKEASSLGMGIMKAFATQLGGSLELLPGPGTSLSVAFSSR